MKQNRPIGLRHIFVLVSLSECNKNFIKRNKTAFSTKKAFKRKEKKYLQTRLNTHIKCLAHKPNRRFIKQSQTVFMKAN